MHSIILFFSEENIQKFQIPSVKNASDMENHVFLKAKTKVFLCFETFASKKEIV